MSRDLDTWLSEQGASQWMGRRIDPHSVAYRYGQRLFNFVDPLPQPRGLIIGEAPGPQGDPRLPLFPDPENSSANRLRKYAGMTHAQWLGLLRRANLCREEPWETKRAETQRRIIESWLGHDHAKTGTMMRVLLCGRRVQEAWGLDHNDALFGMSVCVLSQERDVFVQRQAMVAFLPHPSGLNYVYNDPAVRTKAGEYVLWCAGLREEL